MQLELKHIQQVMNREIKFRGKRILENNRRYRKSPKGVLTNMYNHMKNRHEMDFSLADFHEMFINDRLYIRLYSEWVNKGYNSKDKPSVDRINRNKGYSIDNIQMRTWAENRYKQRMEMRKRKSSVIQYKDGVEVCRYKSQRDAVLKTRLHQGLVSAVLNGLRTHTVGFQFKYIHDTPELLNQK